MRGAMAATSPARPRTDPGQSFVSTHTDWASQWDVDPTLTAAPRYTVGAADDLREMVKTCQRRLGTGTHDKVLPLQKFAPDRAQWRIRDSQFDKNMRAIKWVPEPGRYRIQRLYEQPEDSTFSNGVPTDRKVGHKFSRSVRQVSMPCLKKGTAGRPLEDRHSAITSRPSTSGPARCTRLPSSQFTGGLFSPGPGAYTSYGSFGAASGPSRVRYFSCSPADNRTPRPVDKFKRDTHRGEPDRSEGAGPRVNLRQDD